MMQYIDRLNHYFEGDRFAIGIGAKIEKAGSSYALCSLAVTDGDRNAAGRIQGGVLFTLGDFAFAVAANSCGRTTVTLDATISFARPAKGSFLYAEAEMVSQTRRIAFYQVRIFDELGTDIARMQLTGFVTEEDNGLCPPACEPEGKV